MALAALSACSPAAAIALPSAQPAAALVDGHAISMATYQARLAVSRARDPYAGIPEAIPSTAPKDRLEDFTIQQLVQEQIIEDEARARGISISEQELTARLNQLQQKAGAASFDAAITRNGFSPSSFRDYQRALLTEVALLRAMAGERAQSAASDLKAGKSFTSVVASWNDDQGTAARHGEIGWLRPADLPEPALRNAVSSMATGSTSAIIETERGFVIAHLLDRRGDEVRLAAILILAPSVDLFSAQSTPAWFAQFVADRESALLSEGKLTINVGSHA